ncbi:sulfite exporter TauE/SafE family protein [Candidatus Riflebacteria bacterium]
MLEIKYLLIPGIAFIAFFVKAMTGFGPALIFIALTSLFITPHVAVVVSSILDTIAGFILLRVDWKGGSFKYCLPLVISITTGSVLGSIALKFISPEIFLKILVFVILFLGFWFLKGRSGKDESELLAELPAKSSYQDAFFTFLGGFSGGLMGISGPPIIWHFGRSFNKLAFRQVLIPIFLASTIARVITYTCTGLTNMLVMHYVLLAIPGLLLGLYVGNRIFLKISELTFNRIVGIALILAAIKQLF